MGDDNEASPPYTVVWGTEQWKFNAAAEVRAFAAKRLDRSYEIYYRRKLVKLTDLKDD